MCGLAFAIVGHLFGDYVLQNDWQACNKKKSTLICAIHCLLWTTSVVVFAGWFRWWVFPVLFLTHFAQDRTNFISWWMGKVGQSGFRDRLSPWAVIAVDNTFHIVILVLVARWLGLKS